MSLVLRSKAFEAGARIPNRYTCEGENLSPPLEWEARPEGTESFVLICDDPDVPSGVFSHWVLYDIPSYASELPLGVEREERPDQVGVHGRNSFGNTFYEGPCPPPGATHTYYFRLYALDIELGLPPGANRDQILPAIEGHILDRAELQGKFTR